MNQKSTTQFSSPCGKSFIYVENDMPIGVFHDFLMEMKGLMVERMILAHKQQEEEIEAQKKINQDFMNSSCNINDCD